MPRPVGLLDSLASGGVGWLVGRGRGVWLVGSWLVLVGWSVGSLVGGLTTKPGFQGRDRTSA
jgi:hypothetical protein